jgi:hypothetical protein
MRAPLSRLGRAEDMCVAADGTVIAQRPEGRISPTQ